MSRLLTTITASGNLRALLVFPLMRATLAALMVLSAADAFASCGDYLLPPLAIAKEQQIPAEYGIDRPFGRHHEPPCRGPRCQEQPGSPLPVPVAPVTVSGTDQHWLTATRALLPVLPSAATPLPLPLDLRPTSVMQGRIDRPPCAV